jgi:integrase/recombinase XerD
MSDVNLAERTLLIRETKFFKSRFVPFSDELATKLHSYIQTRNDYAPTVNESPLFINSRRRAFAVQTIANIFKLLLVAACVPHVPTVRRPRVYDIRHTYACSRVLKWYRQGADVTAKLPLLATYMGHVNVLSTQIYLNSTMEILQEASCRFEGAFGSLMKVEEVKNEHQ